MVQVAKDLTKWLEGASDEHGLGKRLAGTFDNGVTTLAMWEDHCPVMVAACE